MTQVTPDLASQMEEIEAILREVQQQTATTPDKRLRRARGAIRDCLDVLEAVHNDIAQYAARNGIPNVSRPTVTMTLNGRGGRFPKISTDMWVALLGYLGERLGRHVGLKDLGIPQSDDPITYGVVEYYRTHHWPDNGPHPDQPKRTSRRKNGYAGQGVLAGAAGQAA